jgi:hypothetical protein
MAEIKGSVRPSSGVIMAVRKKLSVAAVTEDPLMATLLSGGAG